MLELLLGVDHRPKCGGDAGVEQVAEQEVDDEEDDLRGVEGNVDCAATDGREDGRAGEEDGSGEPDRDLGEADGADADDLAGHHLFGADGGEQDLEDARGLLLDDGAGNVHAIEHDDHVHEQEEDVDGDEAGGGVGVFACLCRVDLDGLHEGVDVGGDHALVGEALAHEHGAKGGSNGFLGADVACRAGGVGEAGTGVLAGSRGDPEIAVELFVGEHGVQRGACGAVAGRDDIDGHLAVFAVLKLGLKIGSELLVRARRW